MEPISEVLIERYVRFPATLSERDRARIESGLASDADARRTADFYRSYYAELDATSGPTDEQADRLLGRTRTPIAERRAS